MPGNGRMITEQMATSIKGKLRIIQDDFAEHMGTLRNFPGRPGPGDLSELSETLFVIRDATLPDMQSVARPLVQFGPPFDELMEAIDWALAPLWQTPLPNSRRGLQPILPLLTRVGIKWELTVTEITEKVNLGLDVRIWDYFEPNVFLFYFPPIYEFAPIYLYLVISLLLSLILIGVSFAFTSKGSAYPDKLSAHECGSDPLDDARSRFDI